MKKILCAFCLVVFSVAFLLPVLAQDQRRFARPGQEYQPWVYWFWNNGNLTKEGIKADLEAMKRVGISGVLIMEVGQNAPRGPVDFLSDDWREMYTYMLQEAKKNGIEVNMNNDPGWNGSGGPWIKPDEAMQILSWTETEIEGASQKTTALKKPEIRFDYYQDIVVWAFPTPKDLSSKEPLHPDNHRRNTPQDKVTPDAVVARDAMIDLSKNMDADGNLTWDVPEGKWTVLRVGHTCKGIMTAPAPISNGVGLECDKLSIKGTDAAFNGQIGRLVAENRRLSGKGKPFIRTHIDSWENGSQNWTAEMRKEFQNRRKYDVFPFLPVFAGYVVDSADTTERFLWDFRRTVSELVMDNHVKRMYRLAHQNGLELTIEAYGSPNDHIEYAGICDEPMGEFWIGGGAMETCRGMASAGHVYGKNIVGAEAFTATDDERWHQHPGSMKALGDRAFAEGINRFVFHRYSFQPWIDVKPGLMMGPWGVHYERTQTWWELTPLWHDYLTRCQYMLRQGRYYADILYVEQEDSPQGFAGRPNNGYPWDQCGTDAVMKLSVRNGNLVLPSGMSYKVLVLPENNRMTLELFNKVVQLANSGATIIARRPTGTFGLTDFEAKEQAIQSKAAQVWGPNADEPTGENRVGRGRIVWGKSPETVLSEKNIVPDFLADRELNVIHRQLPNADIYFVANPSDYAVTTQTQYRTTGKPELWNPETGTVSSIPAALSKDGTTTVHLFLDPTESVFLVFRKGQPLARPDQTITKVVSEDKTLFDLNGSAQVPIVIRQATYGVPGEPDATRDVTELVQQMVDSGVKTITSRKISESGDPKFGTQKTLAVEYSIEDQVYTVSVQDDSGAVHLGNRIPQISILEAKYGPNGDAARTVDVKELLQKIFDSGENKFLVARLVQSIPDPAFRVVKTLTFRYEYEGQERTWTGNDGSLVDFEQAILTERKVETFSNSTNQSGLRVWKDGQYDITFASGKVISEVVELAAPFTVEGPWSVAFPQSETVFDKLISWSDSDDEAVKYFSGTAVYTKTVAIPKEFFAANQRIYLDLGQVDSIAELKLDGKDLGVQWKVAKVVDVTDFVKPDQEITLEIRVTNLWPNRLIGDAKLPQDPERQANGTLTDWPQWLKDGQPIPDGRSTFCMWNLWSKDDAPLQSGLLGPVQFVPAKEISVR